MPEHSEEKEAAAGRPHDAGEAEGREPRPSADAGERREARPSSDPGTPGRGAKDAPGGDSEAEASEESRGGGSAPEAGQETDGGDAGAGDEASSEVEGDLEQLVEGLRRERDEYLDLARRAKADFENYRKRAAQQAEDAAKRAKAELARELLPALDGLERALDGADTEKDALAKGVAIVRDQILATLNRAGVESYDPAGERFDPTWHEAIQTLPGGEGVESGTVLETVDRGYRLDGQVLRPARVVVSE